MKKIHFFSSARPLILILVMSLIFFAPLIGGYKTKIISEIDGLSITWSLNTIINNFPALPQKLMQGSAYYPYQDTAAFTDPFITDSLISLPLAKAIKEPLVAFNFSLIFSQIMFLLFCFQFFYQLSFNKSLALLFSLIFSFSKIRLHYYYVGHLQMFSLYWLPLSGLALLKFAKTRKPVFIYLFFLSLILQSINSFLGGYFIIFLFSSLLLLNKELQKNLFKNFHHFLFGGLISGLAMFPLLAIYLKVSRLYGFGRLITEVIHFSLSPEQIASRDFLNLSILIPALMTGFLVFKRKKDLKNKLFFFPIALFFFLIALGPVLHWQGKTLKINFLAHQLPIPLPYAIFYYLLPGFKAFRTPSRWIFMFGFTLTAALVVVWAKIFQSISKKQKLLWLTFFSLIFLAEFRLPQKYFDFPLTKDYPAVYFWLKDQPGKAVIEIPVYYWGDFENSQLLTRQMIYSLMHKKRIFGGYCSFSPRPWEDLVVFLRQEFPSEASIFKIKELGIDYLVVHQSELEIFLGKDFSKKMKILKNLKVLKEVYNKDDDLVYSF